MSMHSVEAVAAAMSPAISPELAHYTRVHDIYLSARALSEAAIRYQAIPRYADCDDTRKNCRAVFEAAVADMLRAIND